MNYRLTNKPYYKQASNKTEIQIIMDSPYTVITRDVTGDMTNESAEKQIQAVLNQLAVEFDPTNKLTELDALFNKYAKDFKGFEKKAETKITEITKLSEMTQPTLMQLIEVVYAIDPEKSEKVFLAGVEK